jgi:hypothetical protein
MWHELKRKLSMTMWMMKVLCILDRVSIEYFLCSMIPLNGFHCFANVLKNTGIDFESFQEPKPIINHIRWTRMIIFTIIYPVVFNFWSKCQTASIAMQKGSNMRHLHFVA